MLANVCAGLGAAIRLGIRVFEMSLSPTRRGLAAATPVAAVVRPR